MRASMPSLARGSLASSIVRTAFGGECTRAAGSILPLNGFSGTAARRTARSSNIHRVRFASTQSVPNIPDVQWAQVVEKKGGRKFIHPRGLIHRPIIFVRYFVLRHSYCVLTNGVAAVVYKQIPVPKPGPDEVLINVKFSGVCHTDLHAVMGDWPVPVKMPLIGGHEGAGVVVGRGELVKDIELGDHAGIKVRQHMQGIRTQLYFPSFSPHVIRCRSNELCMHL